MGSLVPTGIFAGDMSTIRGGVGTVIVFLQESIYDGPNATGVIDPIGKRFWMADGTAMSGASFSVTSSTRVIWSIRFHAQQSG